MPEHHDKHNGGHEDDDDDDEGIFAELEAELENDENAAVRERGMERLKKEMEELKKLKDSGHGRYDELTDEKLVLKTTVNEHLCVVHFYHSKFRRCKIVDTHLTKLASKYFRTRFIKVFVENMPFLVTKLGIKVLPAVLIFIDGVSKDRIVGFEDLGNQDNFETSVLESRLLRTGVIRKELLDDFSAPLAYGTSSTVKRHIRGSNSNPNADDDFEFDL